MTEKLYLDVRGARDELERIGLKYTERAVRAMFIERAIPVFMWRGKLVIEKGVLHKQLSKLQKEAEKGSAKGNGK